ncbi:MAG: hypothetical protein RIQ89_723 [Bacteroidota bacterium]
MKVFKFYGEAINERSIAACVALLQKGNVIIIPTDTVYAFAADINSSVGVEQICKIKNVKLQKANFSFLCSDLSHVSDYTRPISNSIFRLMKNNLPGPFTFILNAGGKVPNLFKSNKKTIGIRVPSNAVSIALVRALGNPLMVSSLHDDDALLDYTTDPEVIAERFENTVEAMIDGGYGDFTPSTVIDCSGEEPIIIREGKGIID